MNKFLIRVDWTLEGVPQTNQIVVWAGKETTAHSLAQARIRSLAKLPGVERLEIVSSTTDVLP